MWAPAALNSPFKESMAILSLAASKSASPEDLKETLVKQSRSWRIFLGEVCIPTIPSMRLITDTYNDR